jgi:hypothetical protein
MGKLMTTDNNNPPPPYPLYNQPPTPPEPPRKKGIGKGGKIVIGTTAALMLAVVVFISVPSQNADACKLYESADQELDDALMMKKEGIISQAGLRATFSDLPSNIGIAASKAHGDVLVEMQKSFRYATAYQARQTEDNGTVYFMHQNQVVEACSADRSPIDLE